ncbi:MAG: SIS domain-containing protein [Nitrososphaerota archaeon]
MNRIIKNLTELNPRQLENLYIDLKSAGVIIPSGEGRSKGALSIVCSEMAKMSRGKIVVDRGDIGFPERDIDMAAPILRQRYGQVSLLILSGSGKSLIPLVDAQKMALLISKIENNRDYRIDVITSDSESPLGKLGEKFGTLTILKGREIYNDSAETTEFKAVGILEDVFILGAGLILHALAEAIHEDSSPSVINQKISRLVGETTLIVEDIVKSDFLKTLVDLLERRHVCFFAGLGSSHEVARMTAVRLGHVKRAIGDQVYVSGESSTPAPRAGDVLIVISYSGETEVVASWCKNFKKLGGIVASIVGTKNSTIESLSDYSYYIESKYRAGSPNDFYIKAAYATSPIPLYLVDRLRDRGLRLPEYILKWYHSVIS